MPSRYSQPGVGDPYWFEWYVGLDYVISMLAGNSDIESVTFQEAGLEGVDDVVVRRASGLPTICVQVKHKKASTSSTKNLTFGSLISTEKPNGDKYSKKSLLASLASGWKQVLREEKVNPEIILSTNREMSSRAGSATYKGQAYKRLPLGKFWDELSKKLELAATFSEVVFSDPDLCIQWHEFADSTKLAEDDIVPFLKSLTIEAGAPSLCDKELELTDRLSAEVCAGSNELASSVFGLLAAELRNWTTVAGDNVVTADIARRCICKLNRNPLEEPIRVPVPIPVFPSRNRMCLSLCNRLESSKSKVVFLQGAPGSGKTRLVSCLCDQIKPHPARFYAFKPLDVDDFSYSPDAGVVSPKELWSTLLNQLRDMPELLYEEPQIPIFNEICSDDELRSEVLRLAKALSKKRGSKTILVIDGIDHAARAKSKLTFLKHLPNPESIPEGVQIFVSGQPADLYSSYPQWLRGEHDGVEVIDLPNLDVEDVSSLLAEKASFAAHETLVLSSEIISMTKGNTLSVVYAVHVIADETDCGCAVKKLRLSGLSENVEEYYESIWQKANDEIQKQHGHGSNALDLIASSMHLLDGLISPRLLCGAFPDVFPGEYVTTRDIAILSPLVKICADGSAWPIHNDFRIFVSSKALRPGMKGYLSYASDRLADAALGMKGDIVRSCYSVRLLASSGRIDECIGLFDTSYVIDAVAQGVPWPLLREQAKTVYGLACESKKLESVFKIQLALSTLSQVNEHFEYWLEHRPFLHCEGLVGMDYMVPPFDVETVAQYTATLERCLWLLKDADCPDQSNELYGIWFSDLTPLAAAKILSGPNGNDRRYRQEDDASLLMSAWGEYFAARGLNCDELPTDPSTSHDEESLYSFFQDAFMRGLLRWCSPEGDGASKISGIPISEDAATEMMRDVLTGALPTSYAARHSFFSKLSSYSFDRPLGTMAYALCLSEELPLPAVCRHRPLLCSRKGGFYEKDFTIGLFAESFIFGYESGSDDFESAVSDMQSAIAWIDGSHREYLSFIRTLRASVCLGYSIGHDRAIMPGTKEARVFGEWIQAPSWPGVLTIETCAVPYMMFVATKGALLCGEAIEEREFKPFIFSSKPLCAKLRILEHLLGVGSEIPESYLLKTYGQGGSTLLASSDAAEIHKMLRPLLAMRDRELALHCDEAVLFGSARFTDHKDYSLSNLVEIFGLLSDLQIATESQAFELLDLDNAATLSGDNRMSGDLMKAVSDWATGKGVSQLSRIRSRQPEFKYDYYLIEHQLRSLLEKAECLDDVLAVFSGLFGHAPCCSLEDVEGLCAYIGTCRERAIELGCEDGFGHAVSDIESAISSAPRRESPRVGTGERPTNISYNLEALSDEEVRNVAFRQEIDRWHWEPISEACSELICRGFEKNEIYNDLVKTRGADLSEEGWAHFSAAVTKLVDGIACYADDSFFFEFLSRRNQGLEKYGFGSASNDIAHIVIVRARARSPELFEAMFKLECDSKRSWISCNGRCELPNLEQEVTDLPEPESLPGLVADILVDSVVSEDPHRTENAVRGIAWGGLQLKEMRNRVCERLFNVDSYGRILLEKVLGYWLHLCPEDGKIDHCLSGLIDRLERADEAYVLSLIAGLPGPVIKPGMNSPHPIGDGNSVIPSRIEAFLSEAWAYCDDDCRDVKKVIESCSEGEMRSFIKSYMRNDETFLPVRQHDDYAQKVLYSEMCRGRWQGIPSMIAASVLVDPADIWVFSQIPVFKDPSLFSISEAIEFLEVGNIDAARDLIDDLPLLGLEKGEVCLGWKLYIPYGSQSEYEYYGTARLSQAGCDNPDNVVDREFGCYGLLSEYGGGKSSCFSQNSISLCNVLAGCITMTFCDCQLFPSFAMRKLGFVPRDDNPLIWVDASNSQVAWFEQLSFPIKKDYRPSAYYWQPRLWRWVCNERVIDKAVNEHGFSVYWATESSDHIDQIKDRYDIQEAKKMKSPFEKELEG